DDATSSL
ncbi:hypothetical protein EE612_017846, partial [Oryza sativa]